MTGLSLQQRRRHLQVRVHLVLSNCLTAKRMRMRYNHCQHHTMYVRRVTTTGSVRTGRKLMAAGVDLLSERGGAELGGTGAKGEDDADHVYFRGENDDTGSGIGREGTTPADVADDADERFESMYVICVYGCVVVAVLLVVVARALGVGGRGGARVASVAVVVVVVPCR